MLDDVQALQLVRLVYPEEAHGAEEAEQEDGADKVPADEAGGPHSVPQQHPHRLARPGIQNTCNISSSIGMHPVFVACIHKEGSGEDTPEPARRVHRHCV